MVQVMQSFKTHLKPRSGGIKIRSNCIDSSLRAGHGECSPVGVVGPSRPLQSSKFFFPQLGLRANRDPPFPWPLFPIPLWGLPGFLGRVWDWFRLCTLLFFSLQPPLQKLLLFLLLNHQFEVHFGLGLFSSCRKQC